MKMAEEIARDFGASINKVSFEEERTQEIELTEETAARVKRAPVVYRQWDMSDHGKTSLLERHFAPPTWRAERPAVSPAYRRPTGWRKIGPQDRVHR